MANLGCKKPKPCEPKPTPAPKPCSASFTLCVGDRTLNWDGFCLTTERQRHTPDGTYTSVTVKDGCIVDYGYANEPTYTPPYCNPNPAHCQVSSSGTTADVKISSNPDNILTQSSSGLFSRTYIQGSGGVSITGVGTIANPYIVSTTTNTNALVSVVGRNGLTSEVADTGVTYVELTKSGVKTGVYDITDEFTVDEYGRIISVKQRDTPLITAGAGLETTPDGDSIQIGHPKQTVDGNLVLGAYAINVSDTGHITKTERAISITGGVYNLGAYNVGVNEYGSISSIKQRNDVMTSSGTFLTVDGKIVSYDVTGRLTGITDDTNHSPTNTPPAPMPIRDMYKVTTPDGAIGQLEKDVYGSDIQMEWKLGSAHITIPSYVIYRNQIEVNGALSYTADIPRGELNVVPIKNKSFTVVFRG